jgi:hypothetical protein
MAAQIPAVSVSCSVWERLPAQPAPGRVLAVSARACLLSFEDGGLLSLVLPEIGHGPLNVVVGGGSGIFASVQPGRAATLSCARLQIGPLVVELAAASTWEPRPPWSELRAWTAASEGRWRLDLQVLAVQHAPEGSLLTLLQEPGAACCRSDRWSQALASLRAGWHGDHQALRRGARRLAGLGVGLTPAGDDFLAGLMLRAWLAHPEPEAFCQAVMEVAAPRTTALSAAFLRAAARGECSAAWHELLSVLPGGTEGQRTAAVRSVLAYGQTSGADMLAGFLWGENRRLPEWHG